MKLVSLGSVREIGHAFYANVFGFYYMSVIARMVKSKAFHINAPDAVVQ